MFEKKRGLKFVLSILLCFCVGLFGLSFRPSKNEVFAVNANECPGYSDSTLTLSNTTIGDEVIFDDDLNIVLTDGTVNTIDCLVSDGSGTLTISGTGSLSLGYIAFPDGSVVISGGNINVSYDGVTDSLCFAVDCDSFTISGGNLTIFSESEEPTGEQALFFSTCSITNVNTYISDDPAEPGSVVDSPDASAFENKKFVKFESVSQSHTHNFAYTSSGATLTATCSAGDCGLTDNKIETSLVCSSKTYGDGNNLEFSLTNLSDFNTNTGLDLSIGDFSLNFYSSETQNAVSGGTDIGSTIPTNAGYYYVVATTESTSDVGEQTLTLAFEISKASVNSTGSPETISFLETTAYDVSQMFSIDSNAGTAHYQIVMAESTGEGLFSGSDLTVTKCGTIKIKLTTDATQNYLMQEVTAVLTVNKIDLEDFDVEILDWDNGGTASTPSVSGNTGNGNVTYTYYTDSSLSQLTTTLDGATADGLVPSEIGEYYIKAVVEETDNYNSATASKKFTIHGVPTILSATGQDTITIFYKDLTSWTYDISQFFDIDENAGDATYSLATAVSGASVSGSTLTISAVGTYSVKVTTAENGLYRSAEKTLTLNIEKDTLSVTITLNDWKCGKAPSTPIVSGEIYGAEVNVKYYTDAGHLNEVTENDGIPTEIGTYYAIITIGETNYSKEYVSNKTVSITENVIEIIWSNESLVYDGSVLSVTASYLDNDGASVELAVSFDREFKNAGNYTATASFKNGETTYELPASPTHAYTISKREITVKISSLSIQKGSYESFEGLSLSSKVTSGSIVSGEQKPYTLALQDGVDVDSAIGIYNIVGTCTNDNYDITFTNGENAFKYKNSITITNDANITQWQYGTTAPTFTATAYYGTPEITYCRDNMEELDAMPTDPGYYIAVAKINGVDDSSCEYAFEQFQFQITKREVLVPAKDRTNFVYTGATINYNIIESDYYTVDGKTHVDAGSYKITITLKDDVHYMWIDGSTGGISYNGRSVPVEYDFVIHKKSVKKPLANSHTFIYNGNPQTYVLQVTKDYEISNSATQTEVGTYDVVVSLKSKNNCMWEDGTVEDLVYKFVINKNEIESSNILDANGNVDTSGIASIIDTENGLSPNSTMVVKKLEYKNSSEMKYIADALATVGSKNDKVFEIYDISLFDSGVPVQPNGQITLRMAVPEKLTNADFKLYHVHKSETGETEIFELDYSDIDENGYFVVQIDKFSAFVFVCEQTSIANYVTYAIIACAVLLVVLILQIVLFGKKLKGLKKAKVASVAAPVFFIESEMTMLIGLLIGAGVLLLANIACLVIGIMKVKKSKAKK